MSETINPVDDDDTSNNVKQRETVNLVDDNDAASSSNSSSSRNGSNGKSNSIRNGNGSSEPSLSRHQNRMVGMAFGLVILVLIFLKIESSIFSKNATTSEMQIDYTLIEPCAPHLKKAAQRRVLILGESGWEGFYRGSYNIHSKKKRKWIPSKQYYSHSGENYLFASVDWALQQNGFKVDISDDVLEDFTPQELAKYHRIFRNGCDWPEHLDDHPEILCKIRVLNFWGNLKPSPEKPWDSRQVLSPYPERYNTFIGYFLHSLVKQSKSQKKLRPIPNPHRTKQGFLLGKEPRYFKKEHQHILHALMDDGFTLHSTCHDSECALTPKARKIGNLTCDPTCGLPKGISMHGKIKPEAYEKLMSSMAFLIGFGDPLVSPSPLVGLAHGAAWLNPFFGGNNTTKQRMQPALHDYPLHWHHPNPIHTQHGPLSLMGAPYVYNIDLDNVTSILEAANWAVKNRFTSYTPPDYTPQAMIARTCAIMTDDAICRCPNPTFGKRKYRFGDDLSNDVDCHGNTYVQMLD